jgi:flagellar biosynthesis/type III secretory pathway M-ring protein FliF/YscJ
VISVIIVSIVLLLFVLSMLRHAKVMKKAESELKRVSEAVPGATLKDVVTPSGMGSGEPELNKQVLSLAKERPQDFAEALKNWMTSGA